MKYLIFIIIPIFAIANLEGKRTYHNNNLDKKVEFTKRHKEHSLGNASKKQQSNSLNQVTATTKQNVHDILYHGNKLKKLKSEKKHQKKEVLKTTKNDLKELNKGIKTNRNKKAYITKKKKDKIQKKWKYHK